MFSVMMCRETDKVGIHFQFREHFSCLSIKTYEPPHNKTNKMTCAPSEDSDQSGIHPVWSVFSVCSIGS